MWLRGVALALHGASYLLVTVGTVYSPATHRLESEIRARASQRWGGLVAGVVLASQHLTVCSLGALVLYLSMVCWDAQSQMAGALVVVLLPMQTVVGVLYWTLALWDPWLLFPRDTFPPDDKLAQAVIRRITRVPTFKNPQLLFFLAPHAAGTHAGTSAPVVRALDWDAACVCQVDRRWARLRVAWYW
jgi:hypothetical protein